MDQCNAVVRCDVGRLNFPLRPFYAKLARSFVIRIIGVPGDVTNVVLKILRKVGNYETSAHEAQCKEHPNGERTAYIPDTVFAVAGDGMRYEITAKDYKGGNTALGGGKIYIEV